MEHTQRINPAGWNNAVSALPGAHILQTWEWGSIKSRYGWEPAFCVWTKQDDRISVRHSLPDRTESIAGMALVLQRTAIAAGIRLPLRIMYAPKGPLLDWTDHQLRDRVLADLAAIARRSGALLIKIDPDVRLGAGLPGTEEATDDLAGVAVTNALGQQGWVFSDEQVQFRNTVMVNLTNPEEELLSRMKQKTRYNIRLAARKGVSVRIGNIDDLDLLYQMYAETALRDGFVIRDASYYDDVWRTFIAAGMADPLIAVVDHTPVAALIVFRFAKKCWYLYGMSSQDHRDKMPNHLLQWEAMRSAKLAGCSSYDMWGAPDTFIEDDPLWGVYRFKEGFGGEIARHIGAWDLPVRPGMYQAYTRILPKILDRMRQRGTARLQHSMEQ